jgi:subtilisin family serine protease
VDAVEWGLSLTDGPEVINTSLGWENEYPIPDGNSYATQYIDFVVNTYDVVWAQSAGNYREEENENEKVQVPADAYNAIVVGAMNDKNTSDRGDDNLASFSRRGPTLDGRIKPDLVAPGEKIYTCTTVWNEREDFLWRTWDDWSGTSFSAPHIAGAAALLRSYHSKPYAIKALLLNTADDLGLGGPDNDYGYGYVNLARAYLRRGDVWVDNIGPRSSRFYKGPWHALDTATLVWNRQISTPPPSPATVGELGLFLYDEGTGARSIDHLPNGTMLNR